MKARRDVGRKKPGAQRLGRTDQGANLLPHISKPTHITQDHSSVGVTLLSPFALFSQHFFYSGVDCLDMPQFLLLGLIP